MSTYIKCEFLCSNNLRQAEMQNRFNENFLQYISQKYIVTIVYGNNV